MQSFGNFEFAFSSFGHAFFIDRQAEYSGRIIFGHPEDAAAFGFARFKMGGIDHRAAGDDLQYGFDDVRLCGVNDEWHRNFQGQVFDQAQHHVFLIGAFGHGYADIQAMRAVIHLFARQLNHGIIILSHEHLFEVAGALGIQALTDNKRHRNLLKGNRLGGGSQRWDWLNLAWGWLKALDFVYQGLDVFRARTAAATDHAHAIGLDVICQHVGEGSRFHRVDRFAVNVHGQAGIGNAGNGQTGVLGQVFH